MGFRFIYSSVFNFIFFFILQAFFFRNLVVFDMGVCMVYTAAIILTPLSINTSLYIAISFAFGLLMDGFYDSYGMHAAASVAIAFARKYIVSLIEPSTGFDEGSEITIPELGFGWIVRYVFLMCMLHMFVLLFIEAFTFSFFFFTLLKAFVSGVVSAVLILLIIYLRRVTFS